ncbi:Zinc finger matrin-type protein 3 [Oryzias melastigma]|uniref:Zinc finger matrin-type protein 3 n=2 Tax=Oryzias melastigma TaxID=30732 RepID=A0A3B3BWU2_ORYME|nr:zinc finger matrin-type protein 3 [Oryzias melastigma]KAF6715510.1 Zinc finger matrin-type protein 3 [Oryzias melastigma]
MMALQLRSGDAAYYQSAGFCPNYTSQPVRYGDSSHYFAQLPGTEAMMKPPLSLFSHPQQPFQHMDSLHPLGPPPMTPTQPLGLPHINPAQAIGPPTMAPAQSLGPHITASHTLRPPPITPQHTLGPPPMPPGQPAMAHTLGPPPGNPTQAILRPTIDLTQQLGPPHLTPAQALVPPTVVTQATGRFSLPLSSLSSTPAPSPEPSQIPPRPPGPALIPAPVSRPVCGPPPAQAAPASELDVDEGSSLGMEEQEDSMGLEEFCKPLYCKLCNVTLNSAQQAQAHYQGKNHSKKLRNFYAGSKQPPAIRIPEALEGVGQTGFVLGSGDADAGKQGLYKGAPRVILATENDYCKLCDASFSSLAVAQAHYQGKNHAKRLRLAEAQQNSNNIESSAEAVPRRIRKDGSEYRLVKNRRSPQMPATMQGPYYNPRPRQRIPRDLAMCVTPSGQFYCSMCNCGAEQETDFRQHLESKQHKAKVSELRYRNEMENLGYS